MKIKLLSFDVWIQYFSMKLLGLMHKVVKHLSTGLVGQCRNILSLPFSVLTSLLSVDNMKDH